MLMKNSRQGEEYWNGIQDEKIEFDWTDIVAFIIAFFQVLFPYVLGVLGSYMVIAFLLKLWMK